MNLEMKNNITLEGNIQYFADTTYKCCPPQSKGMKLFEILAYNEKSNKTLLYLLALIYNENKETTEEIFYYLKTNFNYSPKLFTLDFGKAGYNPINKIFPNCRIFPCYFHIIRRL